MDLFWSDHHALYRSLIVDDFSGARNSRLECCIIKLLAQNFQCMGTLIKHFVTFSLMKTPS